MNVFTRRLGFMHDNGEARLQGVFVRNNGYATNPPKRPTKLGMGR
jgi:hypothetical protein